jgi:hypothetical protein
MRSYSTIAICLVLWLAATPRTLNGGEAMRITVSPALQRAPAFLTVKISLESSAENRYLQVIAESPDFYTSSQVQIDGKNGAPLKVFEFRDLPSGLYDITGILVGTHGTRAKVSRLAKVEPSPGR